MPIGVRNQMGEINAHEPPAARRWFLVSELTTRPTFTAHVAALNERRIPTGRGQGKRQATQVARVLARMGGVAYRNDAAERRLSSEDG